MLPTDDPCLVTSHSIFDLDAQKMAGEANQSGG
jgi:hypothetical protein